MDLSKISSNWKAFMSSMNSRGIPVPMARYKGEGSPALTLVVLSSTLVMVALIGKAAGFAGGVDFGNAIQFFYASCTLFFGHSWIHKDAKGVSDTLDGGDGQK